MAITPRLDLRQSQTLVMTPQLQQAIKLLQLSNLDLATYVENEIEQNPLLERTEGGEEAPGDGGEVDDSEGPAPEPTPAAEDPVANLDTDYDNLWDSDPADFSAGAGAAPMEPWRVSNSTGEGESMIEQTPADGIGLRDHLLNQLNVDFLDPVDRVIGVHLIDMLDESGYIDGDLTPVAQRLACDIARVETTLDKLQCFDPAGIFARTLRECLALQLRDLDRLDPAMEIMVDNLDLLADGENEELQRRCGIDDEDFAEMLAEIRALNPKPGLSFDTEITHAVVPDVFIRNAGGAGKWVVEINSETLPRVLVNQRYLARVSMQAKTKGEKEYLTDRLTSANWLIKSLDQRANTILKVATELVRQQNAFFTHGVQHLRPMIMRDIAEAIEMHESTVSRVTANKYMSTPRGMFEMRYFFTNAIASTRGGGEGHSSEAVRHRIRALIEQEDPREVLSDDRLVTILKGAGIDIARRTVAKYRESMRIPSSLERRRRKKRRA